MNTVMCTNYLSCNMSAPLQYFLLSGSLSFKRLLHIVLKFNLLLGFLSGLGEKFVNVRCECSQRSRIVSKCDQLCKATLSSQVQIPSVCCDCICDTPDDNMKIVKLSKGLWYILSHCHSFCAVLLSE